MFNEVKRQVLIGRWRFRRFVFAIPFYLALLGKYAWLKWENNHLRGRIIELERYLEVNK